MAENFGIGMLEFMGYKDYFEKLKKGAENIRAIAAFALGQIGDKKTVAQLIETLNTDTSSMVKIECIRSLMLIKDIKAKDAIEKALNDENPSVRAASAIALGVLKAQDAIQSLFGALHDISTEVRVNAIDSLAEIGTKDVIDAISKALKDPEAMVRIHAVGALGVISSINSIPKLIEMLDDSDAITKMMSAWSLSEIGEPAIDALIQLIENSKGENRIFALEALSLIKSSKAIPFIKKLTETGEEWIKNIAKEALKKMQEYTKK